MAGNRNIAMRALHRGRFDGGRGRGVKGQRITTFDVATHNLRGNIAFVNELTVLRFTFKHAS